MKKAAIVLLVINISLIILFILFAIPEIRELPTFWHLLLGVVIIGALTGGLIIGFIIRVRKHGWSGWERTEDEEVVE